MFSSVGWGEILVLVIVGLIVVGPERLPRIITDVKAMILAARNAVTAAREELGDDFKEDLDDFRKPLAQIDSVRRMGARGLVSKALLDDDPEFLRDLGESARGVADTVSGKNRSHGDRGGTPVPPADPAAPGTTGPTSSRGAADTSSTGTTGKAGAQGADWGDLDDGDVL